MLSGGFRFSRPVFGKSYVACIHVLSDLAVYEGLELEFVSKRETSVIQIGECVVLMVARV